MKERFRPIWQVFLAVMLLLSLGLVIAIHTSTPVLAATITSNRTGNWNVGSTWVGGVVPGATDNVVIATGHTVTILQDSTVTCGDLNVIGTLSMNGPSGSPANIHVYGGGTSPVTTGAISGTGTITNSAGSSGGANVQFYGDWSFNGTMSGYVSFYFEGSQDQDTAGGKVAFPRNLFIQKGGGTVYFPVTPTWTYHFQVSSGSVCYNAAGSQVVAVPDWNGSSDGSYPYPANLTIAGSGSKTTTGVTVNGVFSIEGTATASAAPTYGSSATLRYNTATARTAGPEWITSFAATGGVIIDNTGTITLNAAKVFNANIPLTINSGATLATNNFQLTFGGNFVNNGGTFTAGSSPIVIANTMATQSIAGFNTTGTVSMTKTSGTATFTGNVNGGALTISGSGGTLNLGTGLTHNFTGTWTRTAGTLAGNSSTLNLGGALSGTGGTFTAGTGTVNYYGAAQTIAAVTYNNLIINQSSGSASLNGDVTVNGVLTLTNGGITTGSNKVIIPAGGSVSRTSGHIIGNLQKNVATGSSVSRTFEVGTASGYDPIVVNFGSVSVAGNLIANATAGEHPNIGTSAIDSSEDVNVYWSFTNSGITFTNYDATFNFNAGDTDGGADTDDFIVGKYDADWTYPTIGTKTSTSTQATGVTSLSDFVLGEAAAPTFTETFSTNSTFTVPAGVYQITVEGWGGGGGGGGRSSSSPNGGAGGGGGGAYARVTINVTPGDTYNVTVGGDGAGGPAGNNAGSAGGDSYFYKTGGANLTLAKGGLGGTGGAGGAYGAGGAAGSCIGDFKYSGGNGAAGTTSASGGGGGGAGNQTAGGNASGTTGGTGGTYDGGAGGAGRTTSGTGSAGSELGGGGSGACRLSSGGGPYAGGAGARGEVRITYKPAPDAPVLYPENDVQIAFNNIRQNTTTPIFRVSATHTGNFTSFKLELNTAPDFTGTAYRQTFSGNYSSGTQYNLLADTLSPSLPTTNNATYYVRFRASADAGAHWSEWSTVNYPVWTFTYKSTDELPDWFQTTDAQFGTGNLTDVQTDSPNNRVRLSGSWQQQILNVSGGGTFQVPALVTEITVEAWGAGGAGGGRTSYGRGGAGGGGAYASKTFTGLTPGSNISYYVAPTTTGTTGSGAAGNASWFSSNNSSGLVAAGGSGGLSAGGGGAGGSTASSYGDVEYGGGTGGTADSTWSGGGGGGAGSGGAGGNANGGTAGTGTADFGGTGGAGRSSSGYDGNPGSVYGGGGGGAYRGTSTNRYGGTGAQGLIRVTWWQPAAEGTIVSPAIEFDWVPGDSGWGEVQVNATTATNNSITVQVLNAVGSAISGKNCTIANGGTYGEIDLTDVTPTGNNTIFYLRATLTNSGGGTPYLNDWMVTWVTAAPEPSTITVTAPSAIAFDTLVWGDNAKSSATNGTVTVVFGSGSPTGWQVTAQDLTNGGYMKSSNATLANMLQISGNGSSWAYADVGIAYNGTVAGNYTLPFWARQVINTNEVVGAYNITIVFTGEILY